MRLWSIHPEQLDRRALVAGWREALLAQKVLDGRTKGYTNHPQLQRFRATPDPMAAITTYLHGLADGADARGYTFDRTRVLREPRAGLFMTVTQGQLDYEWNHLVRKVTERDPAWHEATLHDTAALPHPMFRVTPGEIERWEII